mgnify:CR=1 FL=1
MGSILDDVKKVLGLDTEYTVFDKDLIIHINTVFMILNQIGVGPHDGFTINDNSTTLTEYVNDDKLEAIKTYIYLRVRLLFDPPTNSFLITAMESQMREIEWRLNLRGEADI